MSLINTLNKRGSPHRSLGHSFVGVSPATQYYSVNFNLLFSIWQDFKRETEWDDIPYADNLSSNMSWGRQSNAFERSINIAATYWFLSRASRHSSRSLSSVVWHLWPRLKAHKKGWIFYQHSQLRVIVFSKKIFWFPILLIKIFWFWWRKKK